MKFFKKKDAIFTAIILMIFVAIGLWGYFGKWFSRSPQEIAEERGMTIGKVESRNDGALLIIFENESIGRKRIEIYPNSWDIYFVPDKRDYVRLFFEVKGIKNCEKLSDEELIKEYLQKIEVHYRSS